MSENDINHESGEGRELMVLTLPVVHVVAENVPDGWEKATKATWEQGALIPTQYDVEGDPLSRDVALFLTITNPLSEPRLHRAMPAGLVELETYRQEVVDGIHDHWVNPDEGKWEYTYHERLFAYAVPGLENPIDQIEAVVDQLVEAPHTRRAQAIVWKPWEDAGIHDPACLQRLWFRIFGDELICNCHIRSNDAYKAAYMNMYAFTELQKLVAERVSERLERLIWPGQYNHIADSYHIYGSYFEEFEGFLQTLESRDFEGRTWRTDQVAEMLADAKVQIARSVEIEKVHRVKGVHEWSERYPKPEPE